MSSISSLPSSYRSAIYGSLYGKSDSDASGSVSSDELSDSLSTIQATLQDSTLKADTLFSSMDEDGDGAVTKSEYKAGLASLVAAQTTTTTSATQTRQDVISSYLKGLRAGMVSSLLGTKEDISGYSSAGDVISLFKAQSSKDVSYSSIGTSVTSTLVGTLFDKVA
jgi:hypothetical protein